MAADEAGNDVQAVGVPVTGRIAFAPYGTALLTPQQGSQDDITSLMTDFTPIGLLKTEGGPQWAWAADGDPIDFWQDGYTIPSGLANVTLSITAGEILNAKVREIIAGITPDSYGYVEYDGGGHATRWVLFTEEIFKNGAIRRRIAASAQLQTAAEERNTRGTALGNALTFEIHRHADLHNRHFGEWVLPPEGSSES